MSESLSDGYLPLWNPYINFGFPQYGDMSGGYWSPITWLMASTVGYNAYSFTLELFLYLFIGAVGMYKLTSYFELKKELSIAAAIVFMCCGYHAGHLQHFNWVSGSAFLPCCCWSYFLLVKSPSLKIILLNVILFYLFLSSAHPGIIIGAVYFFVPLALYLFLSDLTSFKKSLILKKIILPHVGFSFLLLLVSVGMMAGYADIIPNFVRGEENSFLKKAEDFTSIQSWLSVLYPMASMKNETWFVSDLTLRNSYFGLPFLLFFLFCIFGKKTSLQKFLIGLGLFFFLLSTAAFFESITSRVLPLIGYVRLKGEFRIFALLSFIIVASIELGQYFKIEKKFEGNIKWIFSFIMTLNVVVFFWSTYQSATTSSFLHFTDEISNQSSITASIKLLLNKISFYDCFWIQGIFQMLFLWLIWQSLKTANLLMLLKVIAIDMIVATLLVVPFTGAGKASLHQVQAVLNQSPKGIPIPPMHSIELNDSLPIDQHELIGSWSMFNKQIGTVKEVPYPIQLKNMKVFFADSSGSNHSKYFNKPFLFVKEKKKSNVNILSFSPNKIHVEVNAVNIGDHLIIQQNYYPHWTAIVNGKFEMIAKEGTSFMSLPLQEGDNNVSIIFEPAIIKKGMLISLVVFCFMLLVLLVLILKPKSPSLSSL